MGQSYSKMCIVLDQMEKRWFVCESILNVLLKKSQLGEEWFAKDTRVFVENSSRENPDIGKDISCCPDPNLHS